MTRLLVTGSRNWSDWDRANEALRTAWVELGKPNDTVLVHGDARGLDRMAANIWLSHGFPVEKHPADWNAFGKRAGIMRNIQMVELGADICCAFPIGASTGTRHCMGIAAAAGIPVKDWGI